MGHFYLLQNDQEVRRFDVVAGRPPTLPDAEAMLDAQRPLLEAHHGARISPAAVSAAVRGVYFIEIVLS